MEFNTADLIAVIVLLCLLGLAIKIIIGFSRKRNNAVVYLVAFVVIGDDDMLADIIVIAILVVIVALVIRTIIKSKKAGKSLQCGMDCSHCKGCH